MNLSKAFDCVVHDLLLAKLKVYGFDYNSLKLINSFLRGRKWRTKIGWTTVRIKEKKKSRTATAVFVRHVSLRNNPLEMFLVLKTVFVQLFQKSLENYPLRIVITVKFKVNRVIIITSQLYSTKSKLSDGEDLWRSRGKIWLVMS